MIVTFFLWLGVILLIQGAYTYGFGDAEWFFVPHTTSEVLPIQRRVLYGSVTIAAAAFPLAVGVQALIHMRGTISTGDVFSAAMLGIPGIVFLVRPITAVEWARQAL